MLDDAAARFVIRVSERKYGAQFAAVAKSTSIEELRSPYRAPLANVVCERFVGSVRPECLVHLLILSERQLYYRAIKGRVAFFNAARPRQGIYQRIRRRWPRAGRKSGKARSSRFPF
jgi:hypothetical protein